MWTIRILKFSLAFLAGLFALLLLEGHISLGGELEHVQNEVVVHLFSFCIGFTVWGTIESIEKYINKVSSTKNESEQEKRLQAIINTSVGSQISTDFQDMKNLIENSIETRFNSIKKLTQEEAFLLAKDAIINATKIYAIGVIKEALNEKKDYLESTEIRTSEKNIPISYRRIMSHNISDDFMNHLSIVLKNVNDHNDTVPKPDVQKKAEIIIGINFCLPYTSLIIDKSFMMLSLNFPGSLIENDSYIVSKDSQFIEKFSKHFEYIWDKLKAEHNDKSITTGEQLRFLREHLETVSEKCIKISDSIYGYPQNDKNFSLNYAITNLNEISLLFEKINSKSYDLKNTEKSKSLLGVYASFFEQMKPEDVFETVTSVEFWANILRNKNLSEADFLKANRNLLEKECYVKRLILIRPNLPKSSKIEANIDNLDKCTEGIENWNYWISVKVVINYHLGLMAKYKTYDFRILFVSEKMIKEAEDNLTHFSLLTTSVGKTLFIATTDGTEELHSTKVVTQIGKNTSTDSLIYQAEIKLSTLLKYHTEEFQVYRHQRKLIFSFKDDFKIIFQNHSALQKLLGKNYVKDVDDPNSFATNIVDPTDKDSKDNTE